MKLPIVHDFVVPPDRVFAALLDPAVLSRALEGCEAMDQAGPDEYRVRLKVGVAGIKGTYQGQVRITDRQPPAALALVLEGKGAGGFVRAAARLRLAGRGSGTELRGECDASVGGPISAVGSRLIEAAARKMAADFFSRLSALISDPRAS